MLTRMLGARSGGTTQVSNEMNPMLSIETDDENGYITTESRQQLDELRGQICNVTMRVKLSGFGSRGLCFTALDSVDAENTFVVHVRDVIGISDAD